MRLLINSVFLAFLLAQAVLCQKQPAPVQPPDIKEDLIVYFQENLPGDYGKFAEDLISELRLWRFPGIAAAPKLKGFLWEVSIFPLGKGEGQITVLGQKVMKLDGADDSFTIWKHYYQIGPIELKEGVKLAVKAVTRFLDTTPDNPPASVLAPLGPGARNGRPSPPPSGLKRRRII